MAKKKKKAKKKIRREETPFWAMRSGRERDKGKTKHQTPQHVRRPFTPVVRKILP